LTPFVSAIATYTQEFPTSAVSDTAGDGSVLTAAPRALKSAGLGLILTRPRTSAELSFGQSRESGLVAVTANRTVDSIRLRATRALTPRSSATAFVVYSRESAPELLLDFDETSGGMQFSVGSGRSFGLDFQIENRNRSSGSATNRYSELAGGLYLRYGRVTAQGMRTPLGSR
jgi:hypothetical protein